LTNLLWLPVANRRPTPGAIKQQN